MLSLHNHSSAFENVQGGVLGLFGYFLTLILKISEFQDVFQSILMAVVTTTVGVLTKYVWDKILKPKSKNQKNEKA